MCDVQCANLNLTQKLKIHSKSQKMIASQLQTQLILDKKINVI